MEKEMLLPPRYASRFSRRERRQGRHLKKALKRRYWRTLLRRPGKDLQLLMGDTTGLLNAHNPYARTKWFRAIAGALCRQLNAGAPHFIPPEPVYFVTIIDRRQVVYPDFLGDPISRHK
jgi:hypothetical protein